MNKINDLLKDHQFQNFQEENWSIVGNRQESPGFGIAELEQFCAFSIPLE